METLAKLLPIVWILAFLSPLIAIVPAVFLYGQLGRSNRQKITCPERAWGKLICIAISKMATAKNCCYEK